jgi:myo-inositol 2-dehydrogenase / D-chiro-inositol 1-dehydrogenase
MGDIGTAVAANVEKSDIEMVISQTLPRVLRFGVVGIGRMGQQHALNLLKFVPRAKLVCACSPAKSDLEWAEGNLIPHGVAVFPTFEEMIQFPGVDAVVIASVSELHYTHTKASLERGIHVLCEKPVTQTVDQLNDLISLIDASTNGTQLMVGFTRRFDENYQEAAQKIRAGAIGSPVVIRSQGCEKLEDASFMHSYVVNAARGGGFFVDSVIHDIDLTLSFLEAGSKSITPQSVCSFGTVSHFKELEQDNVQDGDNVVGMVQFWGGHIAFHYNSRTAAAGYDNQTEIFGSHGKISVNLVSRKNRLELSDGNGVHISALPSWYDRYKPCFVSEVIAFTDAVLDQKPIPISLETCVTSLTIAQALQDSFRTGKKIDFDQEGKRI